MAQIFKFLISYAEQGLAWFRFKNVTTQFSCSCDGTIADMSHLSMVKKEQIYEAIKTNIYVFIS